MLKMILREFISPTVKFVEAVRTFLFTRGALQKNGDDTIDFKIADIYICVG